tara:strand:- start:90 stop:341 length:252 start_codon:yes stop_codon:yes gene_type:complete
MFVYMAVYGGHVNKGWQKKLFRFSDNDIRRLDLIVEQLGEKMEPHQTVKKPNRTLVLRAIIMLAAEKDEDELMEFIKDALVYS